MKPNIVKDVRQVDHPSTWRGVPFTLHFILLKTEPTGAELLNVYVWANKQGWINPRVISPQLVAWSSLLHPRFFAAAGDQGQKVVGYVGDNNLVQDVLGSSRDRLRFWLQSAIFLACVTLSAAIIQGRWSQGTVASKFDRLWSTAKLAAASDVAPELNDLEILPFVTSLLGANGMTDLDLLLAVRHKFEQIVSMLALYIPATRVTMRVTDHSVDTRFGFIELLRARIPGLLCVIVYGSSVSGTDFADYDAVVVVSDATAALRALHNAHLTWQGKELNLGVYSSAELWNMQLLSGDNLSEYGVCIFGEADLPHKSPNVLLLRNMSFGLVRHRQQLGMVANALSESAGTRAEKTNLYSYFVKIPANIVKGTLGVYQGHQPKSLVHEWLFRHCGFDTVQEQSNALEGQVAQALARSTVATGIAMQCLNEKLKIVQFG